MPDCPELQRMLERLGDEITEREDEALRAHAARCQVCSAQLERLRWVPAAVRDASRLVTDAGEDHPTDLQLAAFAQQGYAADNSDEIVKHLSNCRDCRETVAAAWATVVDHTDRSSEITSPPPVGFSPRIATTHGLLCAIGALAAFAAEVALLAVVLTQFVLAWIVPPTGFESVPALGPLAWLAVGPLRFWVLVIGCLIGAALLRWAAGHLMFCGMERRRHGGVSR